MARSYDVAVAALALDIPPKWIDNLLSRHRIAGVQGGRRGSTRHLSTEAIVHIAAVRILALELGIPVPAAVARAHQIVATGDGTIRFAALVGRLHLDVDEIRRRLASRLPDAVESAPRAPRGRPPAGRRRISGYG